MQQFLFDMITSSLRSMTEMVVSSLGWSGIVALLAGCLLLLTLSAKVLKLLARPRGMAATGVVLLAGLSFMALGWITPKSSSIPQPDTATATQPEPKELPRQESESEPVELAAIEPEAVTAAADVIAELPLIAVAETAVPNDPPMQPPGIGSQPPISPQSSQPNAAPSRRAKTSHAGRRQSTSGMAAATHAAAAHAGKHGRASHAGTAAGHVGSGTAHHGRSSHNGGFGSGGFGSGGMTVAQGNQQFEHQVNGMMNGFMQDHPGGMGSHPLNQGHFGGMSVHGLSGLNHLNGMGGHSMGSGHPGGMHGMAHGGGGHR